MRIKQGLLYLVIVVVTLVIVISSGFFTITNALKVDRLKQGKIIDLGWNTPFPDDIIEHTKEVEKIPFDGLVLNFKVNEKKSGMNKLISRNVWSAKIINLKDYSRSFQALKEIKFNQFTDNFFRLNVTPGSVDWYDQEFISIIQNSAMIAKIAKDVGNVGIFFDTEQYMEKIFDYSSQKYKNMYDFSDYQKQVRKRGREFMKAINQSYPGIKILLSHGYSRAWRKPNIPLQKQPYGLLPAFLDGMLEVADFNTLIYDGYEYAYGYQDEEQFKKSYQDIHELGKKASSVKDAFQQHYRASFGIWLDYKQKWDSENFSSNYRSPDQLTKVLRYALKYTDGYVWIYSQKANWWDGKMPQQYIDALRKAKEQPDR